MNSLKSRQDVQLACTQLLDPLISLGNAQGSLIRIGGSGTKFDEVAAQLEGFARPLWGLASLLCGQGTYDHSHFWSNGLVHGTDPSSPGFWGYARDIDQRMVEMFPIAYSLAVAPHAFWDTLPSQAKQNVATWLGTINKREMPDNNWLWFRVFANLGLIGRSKEADIAQMKKDMDHLDTFYVGNGWSNDGPLKHLQMDYYSGSFAIQFAQCIYIAMARDADPERVAKYEERLRLFASDFIYYFDHDGAAIPFGRSITYRFAMASFWGAVAFADVRLPEGLNWGMIKGLLLRHLRWWRNQSSIFNSDGTLSIGFTYHNMYLCENYNSPGSPYLCMEAFIALAVPASHPFWTEPEQPLPANLPAIRVIREPMHINVHSGDHTFLLSSGQACHFPLKATQAKYGKFAYSATFGFNCPTGSYEIEQFAPDNMLALSDDHGETWKTRRQPLNVRFEYIDETPTLVSGWEPWPDVSVTTILIPPSQSTPNYYIRVHKLHTKRAIISSEAGFSNYGQGPDGRSLDALPKIKSESENGSWFDNSSAIAVSQAGAVGVRSLLNPRQGRIILNDANANIIFSRSVLPSLMDTHEAGSSTLLAVAVFAKPFRHSHDNWMHQWNTTPAIPSLPKEFS